MKKRRSIPDREPDLILTSDWHLRDDIPICRTDNFWNAQWSKVEQVDELQKKFECPVVHAGDLFHHWKPSPWLLSTTISMIPNQFFTVYGNHDVPNRNLDLEHKSGLNTLRQISKRLYDSLDEKLVQSRLVHVLDAKEFDLCPSPLGKAIRKIDLTNDLPSVVGVWHTFVWDGDNSPWPDCDEMTAKDVLKTFPEFDLIVTGDHHKPFTYEHKGRLLVNPGCLTRQAADYKDHKPRVYLWYADTNTVEPYYLKVKSGVVSRKHLEDKEVTDKRIDAFISKLNDEWVLSSSFEENLKRFLSKNKQKKSVVELIHKSIESN